MSEPGLDPPPGVTPNFVDPENTVYIASIVTQCLCISTVGVIVALRVYVRSHILRNFQLEDWLLLFGFFTAVGYSATALTMNHFGGGLNQWDVPIQNVEPFGITVYTTLVLYGPCAFSIKASILVFLARIFGPNQKARYALYSILACLLAYYVPVLALKACICRPISKFWIPTQPGECFDQRALILADAVISVISDMVIFVAPLPLTCNLHMKKKKRAKVAAVFSVGGLACICSAIRLVDIVKNGTSLNQTLVFMRVNLWGIAEVYIGLITACMPVLPAFWKHHFGSPDTTGYSRHQYSTERSIEMLRSKQTKRKSAPLHSTTDAGSDENVLITDILGPRSAPSNIRPGSLRPEPSNTSSSSRARSISLEDGTNITKTVEIKQTYA